MESDPRYRHSTLPRFHPDRRRNHLLLFFRHPLHASIRRSLPLELTTRRGATPVPPANYSAASPMITRGILSISWVHPRNCLFAVLTSDLSVIHQILYERGDLGMRGCCLASRSLLPSTDFTGTLNRRSCTKNDGNCSRVQKRDVTFFNGFGTSICKSAHSTRLSGKQRIRSSRRPSAAPSAADRSCHRRNTHQMRLLGPAVRSLPSNLWGINARSLCTEIGGGSQKEVGTAEQLNGIEVELHKLEAIKSECLLVKRQRASTSCPRSELCDQCVRE